MLVGTQGYAEIVRTADGREMLIDARGIATNPASNRVRATCGQNELVLYVNGVEALRTTTRTCGAAMRPDRRLLRCYAGGSALRQS